MSRRPSADTGQDARVAAVVVQTPPPFRPPRAIRERRRHWAFLAISGCVVIAACRASGVGYQHQVVISSGRLGTDEWRLLAGRDGDGELCMGVTWTPRNRAPSDYGCGFGSGTRDKGGGPVDQSASAAGLVLAFGPSPRGATRAILTLPTIDGTDCRSGQLNATIVPITHQLPEWYPRAGTGWFTVQVPTAVRYCSLDVTFVDAGGHEVEQPGHF